MIISERILTVMKKELDKKLKGLEHYQDYIELEDNNRNYSIWVLYEDRTIREEGCDYGTVELIVEDIEAFNADADELEIENKEEAIKELSFKTTE